MAPKKICTHAFAREFVRLRKFHATYQRVAIGTAADERRGRTVSQVRRAASATKGIARPPRSCILKLRTTFRCAFRNKVATRSSATRTAVVCPLTCRLPTTEERMRIKWECRAATTRSMTRHLCRARVTAYRIKHRFTNEQNIRRGMA